MPQNNSLETEVDVSNNVPAHAIFAMIGFACAIISLYVSLAPTRSFVMESAPNWQHARVLATSNMTSSLAGITMTTLNITKVPGRFGDFFHEDRTAVGLLFLCALTTLFSILGFMTTILYGLNIKQSQKKI